MSYYWQELPEDQAKKIRRHLERCRRCGEELETIRRFHQAFAEARIAAIRLEERRWKKFLRALKAG